MVGTCLKEFQAVDDRPGGKSGKETGQNSLQMGCANIPRNSLNRNRLKNRLEYPRRSAEDEGHFFDDVLTRFNLSLLVQSGSQSYEWS